jgi:DNA-directed RNA polymerase subunit K/omega
MIRPTFPALLVATALAACASLGSRTVAPGPLYERVTVFNRRAFPLADGPRTGVRLDSAVSHGIAWIAGADFSTGTIEADIRGKDVLQRSFVGIAFAGANDSTYELVYLRPFNFRAADSTRRAHAIQYVADPDYPWSRLRREHPGRYEKPLSPAPDPTSWVRLRLVVSASEVRAYVNDAAAPSLVVDRLRPGRSGRVGLWVGSQSDGDFANVRITPDS